MTSCQTAKQICQLLRDEEPHSVMCARYYIRWFTLMISLISHDNPSREGLALHTRDAEAQLWEGQVWGVEQGFKLPVLWL